MKGRGGIATIERMARIWRLRRVQNAATLGLVVLGPIMAVGTLAMLGPLDQGTSSSSLRTILLADMVYILVVAGLVLQRVVRMITARRRRSAGSQLHLRLTGVFAFIALLPAILVAVFAGATVNTGLEGWFSERVRSVVGASLSAAQTYEAQVTEDLVADSTALAVALSRAGGSSPFFDDGDMRQALGALQSKVQRGLKEAYVIDGAAEIRARGARSYLFDFEAPTAAQLENSQTGTPVLIADWQNNEYRALIRLRGFSDRYLLVSRSVEGNLLLLLDETQQTAALYNQLESERGRLLFEFGILYIGFALILVLAAIWLGLWFAERLSRPVGRLTGAAQRVGAGDLDVRVVEGRGDDEIAMLGRIFNQMTRQLKAQRDALLENNRQTEQRRRLFDSVLSSVTAGVIGLNPDGRMDFANRSAQRLLDLQEEGNFDLPLRAVVPEFEALFDTLFETGKEAVQAEIKLIRNGKQESLLVRMSTRRRNSGGLEGYVVAFDDVTDLVSAQRMAAWGDVARRIAHEIKNPLTPIQLSAERVKRKFRPLVGDEAEALEQYTDVIIRQTNDLRRIVDEFSKFARMPEPERQECDLTQLTRDAVTLQIAGQPDVHIDADLPQDVVTCDIDSTMINQALTNLIKNAGEATETRQEKGIQLPFDPEIRIALKTSDDQAEITISDNGIGLPQDRARLFEPYVTTRDKGTGLGLPIVKKIVEEHGGTLVLSDALAFQPGAHCGAMAVLTLPLAQPQTRRRFVTEAAAE